MISAVLNLLPYTFVKQYHLCLIPLYIAGYCVPPKQELTMLCLCGQTQGMHSFPLPLGSPIWVCNASDVGEYFNRGKHWKWSLFSKGNCQRILQMVFIQEDVAAIEL